MTESVGWIVCIDIQTSHSALQQTLEQAFDGVVAPLDAVASSSLHFSCHFMRAYIARVQWRADSQAAATEPPTAGGSAGW